MKSDKILIYQSFGVFCEGIHRWAVWIKALLSFLSSACLPFFAFVCFLFICSIMSCLKVKILYIALIVQDHLCICLTLCIWQRKTLEGQMVVFVQCCTFLCLTETYIHFFMPDRCPALQQHALLHNWKGLLCSYCLPLKHQTQITREAGYWTW